MTPTERERMLREAMSAFAAVTAAIAMEAASVADGKPSALRRQMLKGKLSEMSGFDWYPAAKERT